CFEFCLGKLNTSLSLGSKFDRHGDAYARFTFIGRSRKTACGLLNLKSRIRSQTSLAQAATRPLNFNAGSGKFTVRRQSSTYKVVRRKTLSRIEIVSDDRLNCACINS